MIPLVEEKLSSLVDVHEGFRYRRNTIINAAIVAFNDLSDDKKEEYLSLVHAYDGRLYHPIR